MSDLMLFFISYSISLFILSSFVIGIFRVIDRRMSQIEREMTMIVSVLLGRTHFNAPMNRWTLDIGKSESEWIIRNLALVAGQNLLEQYEHLNLGFGLFVFVDGEPTGEATFENLGSDAHLLVTIP